MATEANETAFPGSVNWIHPGMTMREWYAGMALDGLMVAFPTNSPEQLAKWAFDFADAMIAEAAKRKDG